METSTSLRYRNCDALFFFLGPILSLKWEKNKLETNYTLEAGVQQWQRNVDPNDVLKRTGLQ